MTQAKGSILVVNGPNLNMLGQREPEIYGTDTLADIENAVMAKGEALDFDIDFRQSNREGEIIHWIQEARHVHEGIIINAAGYTHTSVAIGDALGLTDLPIIEIHISNVFAREKYRHHSYISPIADGVICGFGTKGYLMALEAMIDLIEGDM